MVIVQHLTSEQGLDTASIAGGEREDIKGRIWQARGRNGIEVLDMERNTLLNLGKTEGLTENYITCIAEDKAGKMWIGTNSGGINVIDNTVSIDHLSSSQGLSDNSVWSLTEDDKENIWMGSNTGLDIVNTKQHWVKHISDEIPIAKGTFLLVKVLQARQGIIWEYAAKSALNAIDLENKRVKIYGSANLPFSQILGMLQDHRGMIWMSVYGAGVIVFNPISNTFRHLNTSNGLAGNLPWKLLEDKSGRIWIATSKGLSIVEADGESIRSLHKEDGLNDNVTQALVQDSLGRMWVSANEGIDMIDMDKNTITAFTKEQGMTENESYALETVSNKIYAGTSSGINIIENSGNDNWQINSFARPQGFYYLDVNSNASLLLKNGKLLWGIQQAVTMMDQPVADTAVLPAYITGIAINGTQQFFYNAAKTISANTFSDTLWGERKDTFYSKNNLDKAFYKNDHISWASAAGLFNMPAGLQLGYNYNQVSFQFTGMHTSNGDKVRYRYILEGLDDHWSNETEKAQSPDYNNLSSGDYTFKVSSKGANGRWSEPAEFSFSILPPWWKTWWAYTLYVLAFAAIVRAYVLYRSRVLKRENALLEDKVSQRTNELKQSLDHLTATQAQLIQAEKMASLGELTAGIAHEIQNPLNFVNNFSEVNAELLVEMNEEMEKGNYEEAKLISKDLIENEQKINHHGKRADAIVKSMLQHSNSNKAAKEQTDINKLTDEYLRLAYHGLRAKDKSFNAAIKTDFDETIPAISIISQDIGRVILNIITNAFYTVAEKKKAHPQGYEPAVTVSTKKDGNKIEIRIKDNGNGIPQKNLDKIFQPFFTTKPTGQGTGLGLSLSYDIIKAHGGTLKVETTEGEGSTFIIQLPDKN